MKKYLLLSSMLVLSSLFYVGCQANLQENEIESKQQKQVITGGFGYRLGDVFNKDDEVKASSNWEGLIKVKKNVYQVKVKQKFREFNEIIVEVDAKTQKIFGIMAFAKVGNPKIEYDIVKKLIEKKYQHELKRDPKICAPSGAGIKIDGRTLLLFNESMNGNNICIGYLDPSLNSESKEYKELQKKAKELQKKALVEKEIASSDTSAL